MPGPSSCSATRRRKFRPSSARRASPGPDPRGGSMDELTIRLYREAIRRLEERGVGPEGTITVRDLFEEVVPYASVRETLGFELKADYDHALLQLLASPDSPLSLEPGEPRDAMRRELG